ncbi:MAG: stage II sporulation protein D [Firmicutes bacterium]|nr:stage II sporulation protein D [Bacillota bacterium]
MVKRVMAYFLFLYIILAVAPVFVEDRQAEKIVEATDVKEDGYNFDELEDYVKGVVAAEMPAQFNDEALKAQAVCARTYAIHYMEENDSNEIPYDIYQAYCTVNDMREKWGNDFEKYYSKISSAVEVTRGQIMIYDNEPVLAVFHSMSAGKTENSENIWGGKIDYLKSVDSSFDESSPGFIGEKSFSTEKVKSILKQKDNDIVFAGELLIITERTEAGYVRNVKAGNKNYTGKQIREMFGLRSANFDISYNGDNIVFTTKGYGHGAGLSQYGANHMAEGGSTYIEILKHYYTGVELAKIKLKA